MVLWKGKNLPDLEDVTTLESVYTNSPINPLLRFLVDPAIQITTKSYLANLMSVLVYIFFLLNMTATPSKYCESNLPTTFIQFASFFQSFLKIPVNLNFDMLRNPQLYTNIIITICGVAYFICIGLYISRGFLTPSQQKAVFVLDEILAIPVVLFYPSTIFSDLISYSQTKAMYIIFFVVVDLAIFPAYLISLIRRFVSISSFGLPYVVGCPKKSLKNISLLSLVLVIINFTVFEKTSPFNLISAAFISLYEGFYVFFSPYFITSYMGFFSLSHPFITSWTCVITTVFFYYKPTIQIYFAFLYSGYVLIGYLDIELH